MKSMGSLGIGKLVLAALLAVMLVGCAGGVQVELAPEMVSAMTTYADTYAQQYPENADLNIAQLCADEPTGLYWNEVAQIWAVACEMPGYDHMYGAVLMDTSFAVLSTDHINATSLKAFEDVIRPSGWVRK